MFKALGRFVVNHPWWTIAIWIVAAVLLVAFAPTVKPTNNQEDFLPGKYESVKAFEAQEKAFPQAQGETALVVASRKDRDKLSDDQKAKVSALSTELTNQKIKNVRTISPPTDSATGTVQLINVELDTNDYGGTKVKDAIEGIRDTIKDNKIDGLNVRLTGNAATNVDAQESFEESDKLTLTATVIV